MDLSSPLISVRGSSGLHVANGPPSFSVYDKFPSDSSKFCRSSTWSGSGDMLAWSNGRSVNVVAMPSCATLLEVQKPQTRCLEFSPKGTFLCTWESYVVIKDVPGTPNLNVYDIKSGACVKSCIQKKHLSWNYKWSNDEKLCARLVNNDIHFFEDNKLDTFVKKTQIIKIASFSISNGPPYHVCCYTPGVKGQPSVVKLFRYPHLEGNSAVRASKSFFRAEQVEYRWNSNGKAVLFLTSTEVDKSGASYYGVQALYLMLTNGDSFLVQTPKEGPIYSVEWSPNCDEFCVVHGYMPAKAALFDLKADVIFDFGTGPRNIVYYNPHGNMLILAGFGNIHGNLEIWDLKKKTEIIKTSASDTTFLEWCPNGEHILTAVTSPRLRVGNGYKIWHYTGSLIYEKTCQTDEELWEVSWQKFPEGTFAPQKVRHEPVPGIAPSKPEASKEAYRPPGARGETLKFKIREDYEPPSSLRRAKAGKSKTASKNQMKNKPSKEQPNATETETGETTEKDKRIQTLKKKLAQIRKLKEQVAAGTELRANQMDKIKKETELQKELENLVL